MQHQTAGDQQSNHKSRNEIDLDIWIIRYPQGIQIVQTNFTMKLVMMMMMTTMTTIKNDDNDDNDSDYDDDEDDGDDVCPKQLITVVSPITPPEASTHTQQSVINIRLGHIGIWYLAFGIRHLIFGIWYLVFSSWYLFFGFWY